MTRQPEMGKIPNAVKGDIKALEKDLDSAEVQIAKFMHKLHAPIMQRRADIISKIEGFWPQALTNCVSTNVYIDDDDHPLLDHLTKIEVVRDPEDPRAAKIEFHFSPNDFINDKVLVKEFKLAPNAGEFTSQFDFATDTVPVKTPISWKSDEVNLSKQKPTTGDISAGKEDEDDDDDEAEDDFEPGSFFSSFFDNESPQVAGSIGRAIVEDLYPNAVHHFEVPALFDEEDEEDDEEEDDEEDEDDGDREIDLEEEEKRPSKKMRK